MSGKFDGRWINKHQNTGSTKFSHMLNMKVHTVKSQRKQFSHFKTEVLRGKFPCL